MLWVGCVQHLYSPRRGAAVGFQDVELLGSLGIAVGIQADHSKQILETSKSHVRYKYKG
jgi:hypothetical protein